MKTDINNQDFNHTDKNPNAEKKPVKRVIKTYRDFAVDALEDKPTSLAKMIIMEKKKKEKLEKKSIKNPKNIGLVVMSSILVLLGIAAVSTLVLFLIKKPEIDGEKNSMMAHSSIISFDYKKYYKLGDKNDIKSAIKDTITNSSIPFGSIKLLFFTKKDNLGYTQLIKASEFLTAMDTRTPNQFIRNLKEDFSFGITSSLNEGNSPFMIFETFNFDASLSNMLAWEKSILYDMGSIFKVNQKYYSRSFNDILLFNKEVRAVLDDEGKLIFGYTFVDSHKIVLLTNNKSLEIILKNLENLEQR